VDDAVRAVDRIGEISRSECRRVFENRFDVTRMARDYVEVYRRLQPCQHETMSAGPVDFRAHPVPPPESAIGVV
jgi:hypothetical protein